MGDRVDNGGTEELVVGVDFIGNGEDACVFFGGMDGLCLTDGLAVPHKRPVNISKAIPKMIPSSATLRLKPKY